MIASELISESVQPALLDMDGEQVLQSMQMYDIVHLPVVDQGKLLGMISEEEILKNNIESPIETYLPYLEKGSVSKNDHLFEVLRKITDTDFTCIPVVGDEQQYLGTITRADLFDYYLKSFAWTAPGSILVIELAEARFSLSEISHIIESENAMIISSIVSHPSESRTLLTLKINKTDVTRIVAALRRYDYDVTTFSEEEVIDNFKERFDALMRYLDV